MESRAVLQVDIEGWPRLRGGKVREIFDLGEHLLMVATDRISAFDVILPDGIPGKGEVLTRLSDFWFRRTASLVPNHRQGIDETDWPAGADRARLGRRAVVVHKARPLPVECVVRGYLAGSGWKDYRKCGAVCGIPLPDGLELSARLPEPVFTPATKASSGHDQNIPFEQAVALIGKDLAHRVRDLSLELYRHAGEHARKAGILIADTKFEFGIRDGELLLIDEALTPDSSRFWSANDWCPGRAQESFDKQFVRDYLETLPWNKQAPGPSLPEDIIRRTRAKYIEIQEILTGSRFTGQD